MRANSIQRRCVGATIAVSLLVAACGSDEPDSAATVPEVPDKRVEAASTSLDLCWEVPPITTDVVGEAGGGGDIDPIFHGVLQTYAAEHTDTYGGLWIDREAHGTIVLAFTDDPAPHREAVALRRPSPDDVPAVEPPPAITDDRPIGEWGVPFDVVEVAYTEAELNTAVPALSSTLSDAGWRVGGAGVHTSTNRVQVHLSDPMTAEDLDTMARTIADSGVAPLSMVCVGAEIVDEIPTPIEPGTPLDVIVLPDADGSYPDATPVECGGIGFALAALAELTPAEEVDDGLLAVLDGWISTAEGEFWPQEGWMLLTVDDEQATFIHLGDDHGGSYVFAEMGRNGWIWAGAGGLSPGGEGPCDVRRILPDGLGTVEWELDPDFQAPTADSTELHVLATERACASGEEMGDRLLGPQVVETDDAVRVAFAVIPLTGGQNCPSNPPTPITITLDSPLGDRDLLDGLHVASLADLL